MPFHTMVRGQTYPEPLRDCIAERLLLDPLSLGRLLDLEPMLVRARAKDDAPIWMSEVRIAGNHIAQHERVQVTDMRRWVVSSPVWDTGTRGWSWGRPRFELAVKAMRSPTRTFDSEELGGRTCVHVKDGRGHVERLDRF